VFAGAAETGVAMKIAADPHRLDLDGRLARRERDAGVTLAIGADAHGAAGMANIPFGVGVARKAWLEAADVANTRTLDQFREWARSRRLDGH